MRDKRTLKDSAGRLALGYSQVFRHNSAVVRATRKSELESLPFNLNMRHNSAVARATKKK